MKCRQQKTGPPSGTALGPSADVALQRWALSLFHILLISPLAKAIHRQLTGPELQQTFGVSRHEHVPDYHLLHAFHREHSVHGDLRRIRFRAWNSTFLIELRPNRRLISPHLISVIRDGNSTSQQLGLPPHLRTDCHFQGRVLSHGNLRAAISDCQRLMGVIVHQEHFLMLQTLPERLRRHRERTGQPHYLVYKREPALLSPLEHWTEEALQAETSGSKRRRRKRTLEEEPAEVEEASGKDTEEENQLFCDVIGELPSAVKGRSTQLWKPMERLLPPALAASFDHVEAASGVSAVLPPDLANYTIPSAAKLDSLFIFPQLDPITLEIGLFLDSMLFEHFKREFTAEPEQHLTDFSLALINNVHVLYQQPSLSPNLDIAIVRFEMWKSQPVPLTTELHKNGQAQTLLDSFCRHQARINPGTDLTDPGHWDHAVLLTGYDIYHTTSSVAGVAPVGRMCDELFACSLVEGLHLGRSFVLAHEMGHNMGMVHDGVQNQCGRSCCFMSAVNGAGKTTWSSCSVREFNAFLLQLDESGKGNCLRDPSESIVSHDHLRDGRLPGQRFTADQQCSYFWGRDFQVEIPNGRSYEDICRILWCGNSGSTISTAHPALEGSWCGGQKWCHQGQCGEWLPDMGPFPAVLDGRWSDWTSSEKQCPVTQCQITGSIALVSQLRTCTAPAPNNGGKPCEGANVRGIVCGGPRSICEGFTPQEYGDRLCSAILHDQIRPDRQLTGASFLHGSQPCKVWCHVRNSELIRNKGQFPNGSPCGPAHFCVGGVCLNMGCDGRAVVQNAEEDCPSEEFLQQLSTGLTLRPSDRKRESSSNKWEPWDSWSDCSATCGDHGVQKRSRKCRAPVETECVGKSSEVRPCEPAPPACNEQQRVYSDWNDWSECRAECGQNGTRKRERTCLAPSEPANGCKEPLVEEQPCRTVGCAHWEDWGQWSECKAVDKCADKGDRTRERHCTFKGAEGDAELGCTGDPVQKEECNATTVTATDCPSNIGQKQTDDGAYWGKWQPCSVSCGIGFQFRERMCGDKPCPGNIGKQARTCNVQDCSRVLDSPVWSEWSLWSACSSSCGQGVQQRHRRCLNGLCPSSEAKKEQKRCVLGPCPQWTAWSPWTKCASCSVFETRKRQRQCAVRVINAQGSQEETELPHEACSGAPIEFDTCERSCLEDDAGTATNVNNGTATKVHGVPTAGAGGEPSAQPTPVKPVKWAEWGQWSPCSASCGQGMRQRVRTCEAGADCGGGVGVELEQCSATKSAECSSAEGEDKGSSVPTLQPEDRRWGDWTEWSTCSSSCGPHGRQSRSRSCRAKLIFLCEDGYSREERECQPPSPECPSDDEAAKALMEVPAIAGKGANILYPSWSNWSEWSACSCFSLTRYRRRFCRVEDPQLKGFCPGSIIDQAPCTPSDQDQCTAIAGGWSPWSDWSQCSQDCGQRGHRIRNRMCASPLPSNRGAYCVGFSFDQMPCDSPRSKCQEPPIDGRWSEWTDWSQCSNPCSNGQRSRARYCSNPRPRNGGRQCMGTDFELQSCTEPALCGNSTSTHISHLEFTSVATNLQWSQWSAWSECTPGCGFSLRRRHRLCSSSAATRPADGPADVCEGPAQQSMECGNGVPCQGEGTAQNGQWSEWSEWSAANCDWTACIGIGQEEQLEAEEAVEGSGEEADDDDDDTTADDSSDIALALLARAIRTRTRTRACTGLTAGGLPCFGPSSQISNCPKRKKGWRKCAQSNISQLLAHIWATEVAVKSQIIKW